MNCGCLQGLAVQRRKLRAKHDLIEDETTSCHDEEVQAKIKAFHEAKQRQANEAKALQKHENEAKKRMAADPEKLNHTELVGRLEKAKAEMEATSQPEAAQKTVPQLTKENTSPNDIRRSRLEDSDSSLGGSTRIESPCAIEMEAKELVEASKEMKKGTSPEDVRCPPREHSNLSIGNTWIESSYAAERDAQEQPEGAKEAVPQRKKEVTSPEDVGCLPVEDSNLLLDNTRTESSCASKMEAQKQPGAVKEAVPQLKEGASPEGVECLPLEDSNLLLDSTLIESPYAAASIDAQEGAQCLADPDSLTQATSTTAEPPAACCSPLGVMKLAATVPDSMTPVAEGQHTQVVLQVTAADGVHMTPQPHEKYLGFETTTETASLKESSGKSSASDDQLRGGAAAAAAEGSAASACKAVLASCAVVVIAMLAFHATSWSS